MPTAITQVTARVVGLDPHWLRLRWRIEGGAALVSPPFAGRGRADGLWRTTCFELFVQEGEGAAYAEFNLSPSERWNAYRFEDYRSGQELLPMPSEPLCTMRQGSQVAIFDGAIPHVALFDGANRIGMTAVLEEAGGVLSYWAAAHPAGQPDFHHADCFVGHLPPPDEG